MTAPRAPRRIPRTATWLLVVVASAALGVVVFTTVTTPALDQPHGERPCPKSSFTDTRTTSRIIDECLAERRIERYLADEGAPFATASVTTTESNSFTGPAAVPVVVVAIDDTAIARDWLLPDIAEHVADAANTTSEHVTIVDARLHVLFDGSLADSRASSVEAAPA